MDARQDRIRGSVQNATESPQPDPESRRSPMAGRTTRKDSDFDPLGHAQLIPTSKFLRRHDNKGQRADGRLPQDLAGMQKLELPERTSGILLHPTSLPGPNGIGSLGLASYRFVDFLVRAQQTLWQILPLSPPGFGDSPYSAFCSVAGNPLLISLNQLVHVGDLLADETAGMSDADPRQVDYETVRDWKMPRLEQAAQRFLHTASGERRRGFDEFCQRHASWLDDYVLFMAIKEEFDRRAAAERYWGASWNAYWDKDIARREPAALERWRIELGDRPLVHRVWQYYFFEQWSALRQYANERGILLIGDMPIFVALDSADVWVNPQLFTLDEHCRNDWSPACHRTTSARRASGGATRSTTGTPCRRMVLPGGSGGFSAAGAGGRRAH